MQRKQSLLTFFTIVTRWSRSTSNFHALIGQNLTGEFMRKIYATFGNLFTDNWSWQSFVSSCDVFNCLFFYWIYKMKYNCYQDYSVIHGWFVYCAFGWEIHPSGLSKSFEIRFRMASLSKMSLLTCLCLRRKRVEKSLLASLDGLQEQHLDW